MLQCQSVSAAGWTTTDVLVLDFPLLNQFILLQCAVLWLLWDTKLTWVRVWSGGRSSYSRAAGEEVARVMKAIKLEGDLDPPCHSLGNLALFFNPWGFIWSSICNWYGLQYFQVKCGQRWSCRRNKDHSQITQRTLWLFFIQITSCHAKDRGMNGEFQTFQGRVWGRVMWLRVMWPWREPGPRWKTRSRPDDHPRWWLWRFSMNTDVTLERGWPWVENKKLALERGWKTGSRRSGNQNNNPSPKQEAPCNSEDATIMMI